MFSASLLGPQNLKDVKIVDDKNTWVRLYMSYHVQYVRCRICYLAEKLDYAYMLTLRGIRCSGSPLSVNLRKAGLRSGFLELESLRRVLLFSTACWMASVSVETHSLPAVFSLLYNNMSSFSHLIYQRNEGL